MIRGKFLSDQWYLVGWKSLLISRTLPRGGQNWTLWFDLSFFGCVSMLVEIDYQRVRYIHITASWQMKCGHGISIISNRRWWFFLLIAMYSYRHRGTVSITKSAIDIPVVGQKESEKIQKSYPKWPFSWPRRAFPLPKLSWWLEKSQSRSDSKQLYFSFEKGTVSYYFMVRSNRYM